MTFISKLVNNNTGTSSKSFFLVMVTIIGTFLLVIVGFVLVWEVITKGTIATDLNGMAAIIGAISSLFVSAGVTKCWSEKYEHKKSNKVEENKDV